MSNSQPRELIARYKSGGINAVMQQLPSLVESASKVDASSSLSYFVVDLSFDLELFNQALRILTMMELRAEAKTLSDVLHNLVAFAKWNLDDEVGAIQAYERSLTLNPANVSSLRGLAVLLNEQGRDVEALPYAKRWKELAPEDPEAIRWYAGIEENTQE